MTETATPETTEPIPEGIERYVEMSITIGFTARQTTVLMEDNPNFGARSSFNNALEGLQDLVADTMKDGYDITVLSDIAGIIQMDSELFDAAGVEPMRCAVRYRESEEWTANSKPKLYTDDGDSFLKDPPPYGFGDKNLPQ